MRISAEMVADVIGRNRWPLLLAGAAVLLYFRSFYGGWTLDDFGVIVNNPDVTSLGAFWRDSYPGRPVRELTFLLDHALFGFVPAGWHVQSIGWHALCGILLYQVARRLEVRPALAGLAALLFLSHPLQVEAVANLSNRKESLVLAFSLAALLAFARAGEGAGRRWGWLALAGGLWGVAMFAKQTAVVLPAVFVLWEGAFVPAERRLLLRRPSWLAGGTALALASGGVWYLKLGGMAKQLALMAPVMAKMNKSFAGDSVVPYFQMMLKSWSFMLAKLVWPTGLAPEYLFAAPSGWGDPWILGALAVTGGCLALLAWAAWRGNGAVLFGLGWFWCFWLPVTNLWPLSYFAADRYYYAPLAGLVLMVALLLERSRIPARISLTACGVVCALLAPVTWQQVAVWESNRTLWTQAVAVNPNSTTALTNLGLVYLEAGEFGPAREMLERATRNMNDPLPYYHLGKLYRKQGEIAQARYYFKSFLAFGDQRYPRELAEARLLLLMPEP